MTWHSDEYGGDWTGPGSAKKPGRPQAANGTNPEHYEPKQEESKPKDGKKHEVPRAEIASG